MKAACDHGPMGELVSHRLGNVALIGVLRERLSRRPDAFPVILTKVVTMARTAEIISTSIRSAAWLLR